MARAGWRRARPPPLPRRRLQRLRKL